MDLEQYIRDVPDFPKPGIVFKDITPLLADGDALRDAVDRMCAAFDGVPVDAVVAAEARGFIFGTAMAYRMGCGFIPVRKPGKLPAAVKSVTYELEYGEDTLCMHEDALSEGDRVLVIDDLLATGGTVAAVIRLVEDAGGKVAGAGFLVELDFLHGREKLGDCEVKSILHVAGE